MHSRITNMLKDDSGSILVVTLLILFAVTVIGATLASISSMDLKISGNQKTTTKAFTVAEAGLNEAIHRLMVPDPTTTTVGGWTGNIAIADSEPYDPNWEARIYLTAPGAAPPGGGSVYTTGTIQDPGADYLAYSEPSGTDQVLTIEHKWDDENGNGNRDAGEVVRYDAEKIPPENLTSGFPVDIITVTGRVGPAVRSIEAEVTRRVVLARTLGALYSDKAVSITGNPAFCGHNHDITVLEGMRPAGCSTWHAANGHLPGITTTGDDVDIQGMAVDVVGDPTPTDTSSANPFYSLAEVLGVSDSELSQILANADHTSLSNPIHGITYIQGDVNVNSNLEGSGLLYVTGDMTGNGDFAYRGLIYIEGDLTLTGTPWVLGSIVVRGTSDYNFSAGNAGVLYSKDAIKNYIGRYMPAIILSWREL